MKKILKSVFAIAIAALAFTSCDDVPMPYDTPIANSGGKKYEGASGKGTLEEPYNVAGVLNFINELGGVESEEAVYVKGKVASISQAFGSSSYGTGTFTITDEGTDLVFTVWRAYYLDNKKFAPGDKEIEQGDEVIICGKVINYQGKTPETVQNKAYVYSINGVGGGGGGTSGEPSGNGTEDSPFNVAAAIAKCKEIGSTESTDSYYIKGIVDADATANTQYNNITFDMVDAEGGEKFKAFQVKVLDGMTGVSKGDEVVVYGPIYNYKDNTPETAGKSAAKIVSYKGNGSDTPTPQPSGENLLTNGDFEAWTGGLPDNWKPASTAGNATLSQSSDAHGGSYAVSVAHATANKRLGHEEITLKAGTYQASCWVKADDAAGAKISVGYAVVTNGKVSSADDYKYEVKDQMLSNEWSNVTYSFTLSSETTISLLVMVNKASSANVIVDDYTLTTSNGGLADGNDGDTSSSDVTYTLTTTIANGKYIIAANNSGTYEVATPLSSAYGYIQKSDVTPSGSTIATSSANEFTLTAVTGGYTIQDASGKYYYMTGNYNSFNVQETVPSEGHIWSITVNEDQTVTITNVAKNKTIQYDTQYNSYGAYGETKGIFPNLFKK